MKSRIRFRSDLVIDGMGYQAGQTYDMPDWLARAFVGSGWAEPAELDERGPAPKKAMPKKPAKKKGKR